MGSGTLALHQVGGAITNGTRPVPGHGPEPAPVPGGSFYPFPSMSGEDRDSENTPLGWDYKMPCSLPWSGGVGRVVGRMEVRPWRAGAGAEAGAGAGAGVLTSRVWGVVLVQGVIS